MRISDWSSDVCSSDLMPETSAARAMRSEGNEVIIINLSSRRGEPRSELKRRQPYRQRPSLLEKGEHNVSIGISPDRGRAKLSRLGTGRTASDEHFARRSLPQKRRRARARAIGARLKDRDQVADVGTRPRHLIAEPA